jgi:hypothetical protein
MDACCKVDGIPIARKSGREAKHSATGYSPRRCWITEDKIPMSEDELGACSFMTLMFALSLVALTSFSRLQCLRPSIWDFVWPSSVLSIGTTGFEFCLPRHVISPFMSIWLARRSVHAPGWSLSDAPITACSLNKQHHAYRRICRAIAMNSDIAIPTLRT